MLASEQDTYLLALLVDELGPCQVHGEDDVVRVRPEALVVYVEEGATIQRVVFD